MRRYLLLILLIFTGCSKSLHRSSQFNHSSSVWADWGSSVWAKGNLIPREELLELLRSKQHIILGENHDNPSHHKLRATLIGDLVSMESYELGFEHLRAEDIATLYSVRELNGLGEELEWEKRGWPEFGIFNPLFEVREKYQLSAFSLSNTFHPSGVDSEKFVLSDRQLDLQRSEIFENHCGLLPASAVEKMVRVQQHWDLSMAERIASRPNKTISLIGNGHARNDRAVAYILRERGESVASVGFVEREKGESLQLTIRNLHAEHIPYDYVVFTAPVEREDSCEKMRSYLKGKTRGYPD